MNHILVLVLFLFYFIFYRFSPLTLLYFLACLLLALLIDPLQSPFAPERCETSGLAVDQRTISSHQQHLLPAANRISASVGCFREQSEILDRVL